MTVAGEVKGPSKAEWVAEALTAHAPKFRSFVGARVPSAHVDDVLQSAAVRAFERAASLNDPTCVLAWLYRIHRNVITDALRKRASQARMLKRAAAPEAVEDVAAVDPGVGATEAPCDCSFVQAQRLHPAYAEVLNLVDVGEASLPQAAKILGISLNNATVRLHRARKALRTAMRDHCGVQSARDCVECRCVFDGCCVV